MGSYLLKRALLAPLIMWILVTAAFIMMRAAPGDPFTEDRAIPEDIRAAKAAELGLDRPLIVQYGRFLGGLLRGDLGPTLDDDPESVGSKIAKQLPPSLKLGALALCIALMLGISAGIVAARRPGGWLDQTIMSASVLGLCLPAFVIGPILALIFARQLNWFPVAGTEGAWLVLPALTLALPFAGRIARLMRSGMLEIMGQDFVRSARAKGMPERVVLTRHVLRGGLLPVIGFLGPAIAMILTGSLVVEQIFALPGIGRTFVEAALKRDYNLAMGTVIVYGFALIICNTIADLAYAWLDPRVRLHG